MLIPDRLWPQMTEEEQRLVRETVQGLRRRGRDVVCPHCAKTIRILTTFAVATTNDDAPAAVAPVKPPVTRATDQVFLEAARTSGLMDAFVSAVRAEKVFGGVPSDLDAFFLLFWRTAVPIRVSTVVLAAWKLEFGGFIEVQQGQGVIAVLSDGELVAFVPNRLTQPASIPTAPGHRATVSTAASFELWTKGKYGYVPVGARHFGESLRQRNVGAFGGLVQ